MTPLSMKQAAGVAVVLAASAVTAVGSAATAKFFDDDPIWVERDTQDASAVKPVETSLFVDIASNAIRRVGTEAPVRAQNLNSVDEVPDSSWFTNRVGHKRLTADDIERGPDTSAGPAPGPWTITSSKSDGVTPGFVVKDVNGERWFLKFDPPGYRAMSTGTEVTVTKLMWALGYNVPENHIAYVRAEQLVVGDGTIFTPPGGKRRAMRADDIDDVLERANQEPDGSYRVVASRALPGTPVGRLRFYGTRPDDPNDIVPHENRRELRGYGVFAAWLNHVDAKSSNSLDTLVIKDGRAHVRHNLIDFGSAIGSGGVGPADFWAGEEYLFEPASVGKQLLGFGFSFPKWRTEPYYESPSIGRLPEDNTDFDPDGWKPRVRNRAFLNARPDDKFWAARKLAALTTPLLRAAVRASDFGDPAAEDFLVRTLAQRRDAIARAYLTAVNPILDPRLDGGILTFTNAAVDADVARAPRSYRASWWTYDNATGETGRIGETSGATTWLSAPADLPSQDGVFIKVQLSAVRSGGPSAVRSGGPSGPPESWEKPVDAYFRLRGGQWRLVGFERMPEGQR
jgi:hypothetical protein